MDVPVSLCGIGRSHVLVCRWRRWRVDRWHDVRCVDGRTRVPACRRSRWVDAGVRVQSMESMRGRRSVGAVVGVGGWTLGCRCSGRSRWVDVRTNKEGEPWSTENKSLTIKHQIIQNIPKYKLKTDTSIFLFENLNV